MIKKIIKQGIYLLIACLIFPLSFLVKRKNKILIIGRNLKNFTENTKYLFLYLIEKKENVEFLTYDKEIYKKLKSKNLPVIYGKSIYSIPKIIESNIIVVDANIPIPSLLPYLIWDKKKINLDHGIGFKNVASVKNIKSRIKNLLLANCLSYELYITTSRKYAEFFSKIVNAKKILTLGYPRHDFLIKKEKFKNWEINIEYNLYKKLINKKLILILPTYNTLLEKLLNENICFFEEIAKKTNSVILVKAHPLSKIKQRNSKYVIIINNAIDIQPYLTLASMLITDYSSIFADATILNMPIIFYIPELEKIKKTHFAKEFSLSVFAPGKICKTKKELKESIVNELKMQTNLEKIKKFKKIAFETLDGKACERIHNVIKHLKK